MRNLLHPEVYTILSWAEGLLQAVLVVLTVGVPGIPDLVSSLLRTEVPDGEAVVERRHEDDPLHRGYLGHLERCARNDLRRSTWIIVELDELVVIVSSDRLLPHADDVAISGCLEPDSGTDVTVDERIDLADRRALEHSPVAARAIG
jgi:hypothetical protein